MKSLLGVGLCALAMLLGIAGCSDAPAAKSRTGDLRADEAGYLAPPIPDALRVTGEGLVLSGSASAGGRVRLATPDGQERLANADDAGRWSLALGPLSQVGVYGLSVASQGRTAQAEGYVVVTPAGQGALLRAGAGARRIDPSTRPGLRAIDFDRGGGVELSAVTPASAMVLLHFDGRLTAQGRANAAGRYDASLPGPGSSTAIRPGIHRVQVSGDGFSDAVVFQVSPAAPLAQGPVRSQFTEAGLRVDWMTPGGGVQSTILVH